MTPAQPHSIRHQWEHRRREHRNVPALDGAGRGIAHVDLGALGTADRWADIAVASMSTEWNYGPGYEDLLIEAYGVDPDRERLAYYRDLWDAT